MGYKRNRTVELKFGDDTGDMAGFEITLRRLSIGQVLDISELADIPDDTSLTEQKQIVGKLADRVAEQIVSWNLLDDDEQPIAPSAAALRNEDLAFLQGIVDAWLEAVGGVSGPLDRPSSNGAPSPAVSIPMEVLLPSPPPLPALS